VSGVVFITLHASSIIRDYNEGCLFGAQRKDKLSSGSRLTMSLSHWVVSPVERQNSPVLYAVKVDSYPTEILCRHRECLLTTLCAIDCKIITLILLVTAITDNYLITFIPMFHINSNRGCHRYQTKARFTDSPLINLK
jgi:hypothetical protein